MQDLVTLVAKLILIILVIWAIVLIWNKPDPSNPIFNGFSTARVVGLAFLILLIIFFVAGMSPRFLLFDNLFWLLALATIVLGIWAAVLFFKIDNLAGWLVTIVTALVVIGTLLVVYARSQIGKAPQLLATLQQKGVITPEDLRAAGLPEDYDLARLDANRINDTGLNNLINKVSQQFGIPMI